MRIVKTITLKDAKVRTSLFGERYVSVDLNDEQRIVILLPREEAE